MTNVTELTSAEIKEGKPIAFIYTLQSTRDVKAALKSPCDYKNIELISRGYASDGELDLMFAYDEDRHDIATNGLYIGKFNSGIVAPKHVD